MDTDFEKPLDWGGEPHTHHSPPIPNWKPNPSVYLHLSAGLSPKGSGILSTFEGFAGLTA